jgi:ABC-type Mn2+/Zn2+ transport system ATPase subunit
VAYGSQPPALTGVDFEAGAGAIVALLGPNGGGKTTLLRALLGELAPAAGEVHCAAAAYVPQTESTRLDFPVSAFDVALMGAYGRTSMWRRIARSERERASTALGRVGLADRARVRFGELSRGQRQRVLIARALVQDAPVLLMDEPFAGVDRTGAGQLDELLGDLRREGRTLLVATHDIEQARRWDLVLALNGRQIAFGKPAEALTTKVVEETYGGEIVTLGDGRQVIAGGHHHHGHGHGAPTDGAAGDGPGR